jgi:hypothetical protein
MIGGHDSGKTNFAMKVWLALSAGIGKLKNNGDPELFEYIRTASEYLLSGKYAPHTEIGTHNRCRMPFCWKEGTETYNGTLTIPDSFGEGWKEIFKSRTWSKEWEELISENSSSLIFLRIESEENVHPLDWISCAKLYGLPGNSLPETNNGAKDIVPIPTQVLMVEWIQFLKKAYSDRVNKSFRPRVGIVISAWDLAPNEQQEIDPKIWLKQNYPLLFQFMETNENVFEFAIFAISIAGFDLLNPENGQMDKYYDNPSNFGYVIQSDSQGFMKILDFTTPVAWALQIK